MKHRALYAIALLWAAAVPAPAAAQGTATIYGCAGPDGAPLASSGGWLGSALAPPGLADASNRCLQAGSLQALLRSDGSLVRGHHAAWRFDAPAGSRIVAYRLARSVRIVGAAGNTGARPVYWMLTSENPSPPVAEQLVWTGASAMAESLGSETGAGAAGNAFERAERDLGYVELRVFCAHNVDGGQCPAVSDDFGRLRIYRAAVVLRDAHAPAASGASGSLAESPQLSGRAAAVVSATDAGLGLYRARVLVDGVQHGAEASFGGADGNCADIAPGRGGPHEFAAPVPCPLAGAAEVSLDTTALADGPHRVRVVIEDAGGNVADAIDRTVAVANAAACLGAGPPGRIAARFVRGRRARSSASTAATSLRGRRSRTVRFGGRARIAGRVRDVLGRPVAGAAVCVRSRVTRPGARDRGVAVVRTGAAGRFRFRAPAGPSRVLRLLYGPPGTAPSSVALRLGVRARVGLKASPRALRNGGRVRLRGRMRGRPYPRRGAIVELQAFDGGRWRTFELTRARRPRGRFAASYRFTRTFSPRTYRFRARLRPQDAYPYRRAASRAVRVFVRP